MEYLILSIFIIFYIWSATKIYNMNEKIHILEKSVADLKATAKILDDDEAFYDHILKLEDVHTEQTRKISGYTMDIAIELYPIKVPRLFDKTFQDKSDDEIENTVLACAKKCNIRPQEIFSLSLGCRLFHDMISNHRFNRRGGDIS